MKNRFWKKGIVVGIIILFVGTSIVPGSNTNSTNNSQPMDRGNWLYVGGSGPGNYTRIQDAINQALDGDTVYVFNDSSPYIERLSINTKIQLFGEDKASTMIMSPGYQYDGHVIKILADNVSISDFTINSNSDVFGIKVFGDNTVLTNLYIQDSMSACIMLYDAEYTVISQTTIENTQFGIWSMNYGSSSNTIIEHCMFLDCSSFGISVDSSDYIIRDNIVISCYRGIIVRTGRNQVINNTIIGSRICGILIIGANNIFAGNALSNTSFEIECYTNNSYFNNAVNGKPFVYMSNAVGQTIDNAGQVILVNCAHMTIQHLAIDYCRYGILLYSTTDSLIQNCIALNCEDGITLISSSDNSVQTSTMVDCSNGINIYDGSSNTIDNNRFFSCNMVIDSNNNLVVNNSLNDSSITLGWHYGDYNRVEQNIMNGMVLSEANNNIIKENAMNTLKLEYANFNTITQNNFLSKKNQATFINARFNKWTQNYWGRPMAHAKLILGLQTIPFDYPWIIPILWVNIDRHPAQKPYEIP